MHAVGFELSTNGCKLMSGDVDHDHPVPKATLGHRSGGQSNHLSV